MDHNAILMTVIKVISQSLALAPNEVELTDRVVDDLGMDSLDFLDIMFSLEKSFGITIRDSQMDGFLRPNKNSDVQVDAFLSEAEIVEISDTIPELAKAARSGPVARNQIFSFVTVEAVARIIERKLKASQ